MQGRSGGRVVSVMDGRFDHDSCIGKCKAAEVCPLVMGIVMANADESARFAVERMLNCEALAAAVTS